MCFTGQDKIRLPVALLYCDYCGCYSNSCLEQMIAANKELIPLVDDEGNTALHLACIVGYANVAGVLIDKGAAVDVRCVCTEYFSTVYKYT